jgi:hypothetical protein
MTRGRPVYLAISFPWEFADELALLSDVYAEELPTPEVDDDWRAGAWRRGRNQEDWDDC